MQKHLKEEVKMVDNWKHRSEGMKCRTCMSFAAKVANKPIEVDKDKGAIGRCRRHAPTMGGFPVVYESDWCGDHKIDEEK